MKNELSEWFCHAQKNSIAVGGQTMKVKADEMAFILKASELDGNSSSNTDRTLHGNYWATNVPEQVDLAEKQPARMWNTNHYSEHPEGYFRSGQNGTFL
jgi:hypothetical protein